MAQYAVFCRFIVSEIINRAILLHYCSTLRIIYFIWSFKKKMWFSEGDTWQFDNCSSETRTQEQGTRPVVHFNFSALYIKSIHGLCSHMSLLKIE